MTAAAPAAEAGRTLVVPRRFCGPPSSGNGGWTAGALAGLVPVADPSPGPARRPGRCWPAISVSLHRPPPLDTPLDVTEHAPGSAGATVAELDGSAVATARLADADPTPVEPVPVAEARAAGAAYPGLRSHPFPTCFACGTERGAGEGMRIFPGPVSSPAGAPAATRVATVWSPHPSVGDEFRVDVDEVPRASLACTWAALDCIGGWAGDLEERLMVLAAMTARVDALPVIGEEHVVVGLRRRQEGRKTFTASTLYDADGRVVAAAEHLWIAVDPADFA